MSIWWFMVYCEQYHLCRPNGHIFLDATRQDAECGMHYHNHVGYGVGLGDSKSDFSYLDPDCLLLAADKILAEETAHWEQHGNSVGDHHVRSGS